VPNTHFYASDYTSGSFSTFESADFRVNAMIRAEGHAGKKFGYTPPETVAEAQYPAPILIRAETPVFTGNPYPHTRSINRGVTGYRLWRLQPGQEDTPEAWVTLTNVPVNALEYTDYSFEDVAIGDYKWAVRTAYHGNVESKPAFSNVLAKRYKADFTVNVTTNTFDVPAGAIVTLGTLPPQTVAVNSVIFTGVYYGSYPLKVTLDGFNDYTATIVIDGDGLSHTAKLIETIKPPFDVKIEAADCDFLLTWKHELAGGKKFMFFNVYLDGNQVAEGITETEYLLTGLAVGDHVAGVAAHYSSANSEIVTKDFTAACDGINVYDTDFSLYPNPANERLYIQRTSTTAASIDLYNALGMHIATYETTDKTCSIDVSALAVGTYFIRVTEDTNSSMKSFVKNNK
jgi:hypothetical protein